MIIVSYIDTIFFFDKKMLENSLIKDVISDNNNREPLANYS